MSRGTILLVDDEPEIVEQYARTLKSEGYEVDTAFSGKEGWEKYQARTRLPWPDPTQISYRWAETVKQHFEANGWRVLDLAMNDAVRTKVKDYLQRECYVFLFYGHGRSEQMCGQD